MAWNYSTGFGDKIKAGTATTDVWKAATTISLSTTTITDSGNGFGNFAAGDWIRVLSPLNKNVFAQLISTTVGTLVCAAGTFTAETNAGADIIVVEKVAGGSYADIFMNGRLDLYTGGRPINADAVETGTKLLSITLNAGTFTPGTSLNGLNFRVLSGNYLGKAIDPVTGEEEEWRGDGIVAGTAGWGRFYDNAAITGASITAVRKDGVVTTTTGGDIVMSSGRSIEIGAPAAVTNVNIYNTGV